MSLFKGKTACFQILSQNKNITEAKEYCASQNMTLAPFVKDKNHGTMKDWIRYLFHLHPRSSIRKILRFDFYLNFRSTFWFDMYTKKSFILSDSHQKAELIAEMNKTMPQFRNGYAYDFELSNGRNYLDAVRDQWIFCRTYLDMLSINPYE